MGLKRVKYVARIREIINTYKILVRKPVRSIDERIGVYIKMNLREM
jgi:hypothetical protein